MDRFRRYEPDQIVLVSIESAVAFGKGSFERFLVETLGELDLTVFWDREDNGGESPYDPRAMLGIVLYGFCRGMFSSRKLENACRTDTGFMYVSGHNCPDHAAICRFIQTKREPLKDVFRQLVYLAHDKGFIDYHTLALDGTKIRANASNRFSGTLKDFRKRLGAIDHSIEKAMVRLEGADEHEEQRLKQRIADLNEDREKIGRFLADSSEILNGKNAEVKQNITDPDCRLMRFADGHVREGYNAQACVEGRSGIIVGCDIVQAESDDKLLTAMLDEVVRPADGDESPTNVLADSGYWDPGEIATAEQKGFTSYIPDREKPNPYSEKRENDKPKLNGFEVLQEGVYGKCPGGRRGKARAFLRARKKRDKGGARYRFSFTRNEQCDGCPFLNSCFHGTNTQRIFEVSSAKLHAYAWTEVVRLRLETEEGKKIYSRRMPLMERTFAEAKFILGYDRFLRRFLASVRDEWNLMCCAINVRRLYSLSVT